MTNDLLPCVSLLGPCPVLPIGSENFPQASRGGERRRRDIPGVGWGSRPRSLGSPPPASEGSLGSGGLTPAPAVLPFQGRARRVSEEGAAHACPGSVWPPAVPKSQTSKTAQNSSWANPPTAWLLRRLLTTGPVGLSTAHCEESLAPHTRGQSGPKNCVLCSQGRRLRDNGSQEGLGGGTEL